MKRWLLIGLAVLVLAAAYFVFDSPFVDKLYNNPIGENVDALEFCLADGSASFRLDDPETIARLRNAHRWTNYHMYCCLEPDEVYAYVYTVVNGVRRSSEPMKIHTRSDIPSFNLEFRLLLRKVCDEGMER